PQPSGKDLPVRNDILRALLNSEYKHLSPKLEQVNLNRGEIIYQADQRIDHVYFPETAVVAMIDTVEDGSTVEVGIIGHEGMVGINIFLGCLVTPDKAIVQISGSAMRMKTNDLRKELRFGSPLQRLLLRYTQALLAVISQSVACSQHHTVAQRLARWLLTMHDHAESNEFEMSHKSIAAMLGARREGVSEAAAKLQAAKLITYSRGHIRILNEAGLKKKSCECYRFIRQQFDGLLSDVPGFLSGKSRNSSYRRR
ncbi:MAG: Crp/Fnr family transcriptional regulator, partial [Burkholderiales bacterium]